MLTQAAGVVWSSLDSQEVEWPRPLAGPATVLQESSAPSCGVVSDHVDPGRAYCWWWSERESRSPPAQSAQPTQCGNARTGISLIKQGCTIQWPDGRLMDGSTDKQRLLCGRVHVCPVYITIQRIISGIIHGHLPNNTEQHKCNNIGRQTSAALTWRRSQKHRPTLLATAWQAGHSMTENCYTGSFQTTLL